MRRASSLALTLAASALLLASPSCQRQRDEKPRSQQASPSVREEVAAGTEADIAPVEAAGYARTLVEQLDLVGADADGYLVIRDLRPLIAQARRVEQVMAGPLARAIPALAQLGGGTGQARLEQLERARELLALVLAGLEGSGVALDQGLVVSIGRDQPVVAFAAADLDRLAALASLADPSFDFARSCATVSERPGWVACSLGGPEPLGRYVPAKQGQALADRLGDRMGAATLESVNVALSLVSGQSPIDATLRTDPGLWELTVPLPDSGGGGGQAGDGTQAQLLHTGPAPALRALVPGTSFMWARVDPAVLAEDGGPLGPVGPDLLTGDLTGELWLGAVDDPNGMVAQAGIRSASAATTGVSALAQMLPTTALELDELPGLRLELDRASIDLDGERVPSIGVNVSGDPAQAWAQTLGVDPRARVWAHGDHLSVAVGEVQAIPAALARLDGTGPSAAALAGLPPTLAHALLAGEAALVMHVVLDHWQAPPSQAELQALLAGLPDASRPSSAAITALFQALAPWSTVDLWISRGPATGQRSSWLAHLSVVPFAAAGAGVDPAEVAAASEVLEQVLAGSDAEAGYRSLLSRFVGSPRASSYRARVGDAPGHHAAIGMVELGVVAAVAIPAMSAYLSRANDTEGGSE
ncbi:hypothetical protein [Enhygromyxa salina]|uniref:hypothetical protein n=1 Tax=Enhygromyxa salina TaxID=215803 RepID=UPI0011B1DD33|nr:hypothetical protein [Enhygromyxa salina]